MTSFAALKRCAIQSPHSKQCKVLAVVEMPCKAEDGVQGVGILRLRMTSTAWASCFAQDDRVNFRVGLRGAEASALSRWVGGGGDFGSSRAESTVRSKSKAAGRSARSTRAKSTSRATDRSTRQDPLERMKLHAGSQSGDEGDRHDDGGDDPSAAAFEFGHLEFAAGDARAVEQVRHPCQAGVATKGPGSAAEIRINSGPTGFSAPATQESTPAVR
jgi:hypothetical protein